MINSQIDLYLPIMTQKENQYIFSGCTVSNWKCRCFEFLNEEELKYLETNTVRIKYKKHELICKQGSFVSHIMLVEDGLAKVFMENGKNTLVLKIVPSNGILGLTSVSDQVSTFQYSAMTYVESIISLIDIRVFKDLIKSNLLFAKEIIDILATNNVQIYGRFFCMTHKQAYGRLADILLCLSERVFKNEEFNLPLSRKEIAELSGMSQETVIRILKKFVDDGLISIKGKTFKLLDVMRLRTISNFG